MLGRLKEALPAVFLVLLALMRWPGLLPENLSAVYGLVFCAGAFLRSPRWVGATFGVLLASDVLLLCHYRFNQGLDVLGAASVVYLAMNYVGYGVILALGRRFSARSRWLALVAGGVVGALLFYVVTNTAAWFFNPFRNPEYTRTWAGWITALTKGTGGYPETWTFFRNTLLGGGLFTGLFSGVWKWSGSESPQEKGEGERAAAPASEPPGEGAEPGEAHA
jgi:hypothetical protein